jgi:mannose-6-phosphate isomerase-like protein (cupin superfamily)
LAFNDSIGSTLVTIPANSTFDPKNPTNPFLTIDVYIPYIAGFTDVD